MSEHVLISQADGLCEIRFNRPDKRNAITAAMYAALIEALSRADADDTVRVVLISGEGPSFTAGNDLVDFLRTPDLAGDTEPVRFLRTLAGFRKVLIAAVHGQTVGIGVTLLLHCELVVAARTTQLSMPFVRLGLVPEAASSLLLPRLVGYPRAAQLLLLGQSVDAMTALTWGLINQVTDDETLMEEARGLARRVAELPAGALLATKRLLRSETTTVSERIEEEVQAFRARLSSAEFRSAAEAFLAKGRKNS
jgi:enoyl-CoA hydratase/carnithine racemase